eukprot:7514364-Alexandrium_andersonii.AAC.1
MEVASKEGAATTPAPMDVDACSSKKAKDAVLSKVPLQELIVVDRATEDFSQLTNLVTGEHIRLPGSWEL